MALTEEQKSLKKFVNRRHPEYDAMLPHWEFLEKTYEGGRGWFDLHIFRYIKEGEREFKERVQRAYRFNHTREVVDLINKYLFKIDVARSDDAPESVKRFWKKSTKNGLPITQLAREMSKASSIGGRAWVIVDNNVPEEVTTKADEKRVNARAFAYVVMPQHVLDLSYDDSGVLNWILINEIARDDSDPFDSGADQYNRYRLWTRTEWFLFRERGKGRDAIIELAGQGSHDLGVVPAVSVDNTTTDAAWTTPALIADIAYLDRAVANYLSNLDAIIQDQTFSQLAMPAQNLLPGEDGYTKMIEMGTKRIFLYDGAEGSAPAYISPDPAQAKLILEAVNKIISEIYHTLGMAGERTKQDNSMGIDNSSGVAKAIDFERVNALLVAKADALELAENRIAALAAKWSGDELGEDADLVTYPESFDVRGLYDEFDIASKLALISAPDAIRQEQMKVVIDKLFPRLDESTKQEMLTQLKDWPPQIDLPVPGAPAAMPKSPKDSKQGQNNKRTPVGAKESDASA